MVTNTVITHHSCHPFRRLTVHLGESTADSRKEWIAALDMIESLKPRAVVAGHKRPGRPDAPTIVEGNKAIHSRLRQDRREYADRERTVRSDARDLSRSSEPSRVMEFGARRK